MNRQERSKVQLKSAVTIHSTMIKLWKEHDKAWFPWTKARILNEIMNTQWVAEQL